MRTSRRTLAGRFFDVIPTFFIFSLGTFCNPPRNTKWRFLLIKMVTNTGIHCMIINILIIIVINRPNAYWW
jgi:hypothetical protein